MACFLAPKMCLIPSAKWVKPTAKWVKLSILFCLKVGFKMNFGRKIRSKSAQKYIPINLEPIRLQSTKFILLVQKDVFVYITHIVSKSGNF